jgi:hypothetical protein
MGDIFEGFMTLNTGGSFSFFVDCYICIHLQGCTQGGFTFSRRTGSVSQMRLPSLASRETQAIEAEWNE